MNAVNSLAKLKSILASRRPPTNTIIEDAGIKIWFVTLRNYVDYYGQNLCKQAKALDDKVMGRHLNNKLLEFLMDCEMKFARYESSVNKLSEVEAELKLLTSMNEYLREMVKELRKENAQLAEGARSE
jgi:hypothetical protein